MGTSTSNNGQNGKTPMVPTWLDENDDKENNDIPASADPDRFKKPRNNFTRYVNSGDRKSTRLNSSHL